MNEAREVIAAAGPYELVRVRGEVRIEDTFDGAISSPLHPLLVSALAANPGSMLDLQLQVPTPRLASVSDVTEHATEGWEN